MAKNTGLKSSSMLKVNIYIIMILLLLSFTYADTITELMGVFSENTEATPPEL